MNKINEIIKQIASTSGRNDKEQLISLHKDNQLLKDIFKFIYCPYTLTGLSSKKINKKVKDVPNVKLNDINEAMEYLKVNNTGKDIDIANIQCFIQSQPVELHDLYKQIFTKDLKIGATDGTLNKVYGKGFINSFDVMLAEKYFDHESKIKGKFIVTKKLDGNRNVAINDNIIKLFTRQGKPNEGFKDIEAEIALLPKGYVYDGEFILANDKDLNSADLYRETTSTVRKDGVKKNVVFHIFDMIPLVDFQNGISHIPCIERKELLHNSITNLDLKWIKEVPMLYIGEDKDMVITLLNQMIAEEEEGVMVNIANAPYECRRTQSILKVKQFLEADVRVLAVAEGSGKNVGRLGAITIQFEHEDKLHTCDCGSGFSDEERVLYLNNPELLIGKIVTIGYFEVSKNKKGGCSLRFPTWESKIRHDKSEISMY